jgi:hypothetical protein
MDAREIQILNNMITFAAENIPNGLSPEEHQVAFQVALWTKDGVPVRPICPHCYVVQPQDEGRLEWLEHHLDSGAHRVWWGIKHSLNRVRLGL